MICKRLVEPVGMITLIAEESFGPGKPLAQQIVTVNTQIFTWICQQYLSASFL